MIMVFLALVCLAFLAPSSETTIEGTANVKKTASSAATEGLTRVLRHIMRQLGLEELE